MNRLTSRIMARVNSTPAYLRWLKQCEPSVLETYLAARRGLLLLRSPLIMAVMLAALLLKKFDIVNKEHPIFFALFLLSLALAAWPVSYLRFARAAWRTASAGQTYRLRLRLLSATLFAAGAISILGLVVLSAVLFYLLSR